MTIFFVFLLSLAQASQSDDRAMMLLHAKDAKSFKTKINSINNERKKRAACDFELTHNQIPKSCYSLKLSPERKEIIDQACELASYKMKEEVGVVGLSKACAEFVNKKNKDIQYSQAEKDPGQFLR